MNTVIEKSGAVTSKAISLFVSRISGRLNARLSCDHVILVDGNILIKDFFLMELPCVWCSETTELYNEAMRAGAGMAANHKWNGVDEARTYFHANKDSLVPATLSSRQKKKYVRGLHTGFFKSFSKHLTSKEQSNG